MEARNQVLQKILIDAEGVMAKRIKEDPAYYKDLMKKLILQVIHMLTLLDALNFRQ